MDRRYKSVDCLHELSKEVSEQDKIIWEYEALHTVIPQSTSQMRSEIERLTKDAIKTEAENEILSQQIQDLDKMIEIQREALGCNQSTLHSLMLKRKLEEEQQAMDGNYDKVLAEYDEQYEKTRQTYEDTPAYREYHTKAVELKLLKIEETDLLVRKEQWEKNQIEFDEIQRKRMHSWVVRFAQYVLGCREREESAKLIAEKEEKEKLLVEQYLAPSTTDLENLKALFLPEPSLSPVRHVPLQSTKSTNNIENLSATDKHLTEMMAAFMNEKIELHPESPVNTVNTVQQQVSTVEKDFTNSHKQIDSSNREIRFNKDNTKVKILECISLPNILEDTAKIQLNNKLNNPKQEKIMILESVNGSPDPGKLCSIDNIFEKDPQVRPILKNKETALSDGQPKISLSQPTEIIRSKYFSTEEQSTQKSVKFRDSHMEVQSQPVGGKFDLSVNSSNSHDFWLDVPVQNNIESHVEIPPFEFMMPQMDYNFNDQSSLVSDASFDAKNSNYFNSSFLSPPPMTSEEPENHQEQDPNTKKGFSFNFNAFASSRNNLFD